MSYHYDFHNINSNITSGNIDTINQLQKINENIRNQNNQQSQIDVINKLNELNVNTQMTNELLLKLVNANKCKHCVNGNVIAKTNCGTCQGKGYKMEKKEGCDTCGFSGVNPSQQIIYHNKKPANTYSSKFNINVTDRTISECKCTYDKTFYIKIIDDIQRLLKNAGNDYIEKSRNRLCFVKQIPTAKLTRLYKGFSEINYVFIIVVNPIFNSNGNRIIKYDKLCLGYPNISGNSIICHDWFDYLCTSETWAFSLTSNKIHDIKDIMLQNQMTDEKKTIQLSCDHYVNRYMEIKKCSHHVFSEEKKGCYICSCTGTISYYTPCSYCDGTGMNKK